MKRVVGVVFFLSLVTSLYGQPNVTGKQYNQTEQDLIRVERDYYAIPYAMQLSVLTDAAKAGQGTIDDSPKATATQQASMADAESFDVLLSNIATGKTSDILSQKFTDFVSVPNAGQEIVHLTATRPDQVAGDKYGSVKAQWGPPIREPNAPDPSSLTIQDLFTGLDDAISASFNRYVAYTVTLRYKGQMVNYKAICLFVPPGEPGPSAYSDHQIVDLYLNGNRYSDLRDAYRPDRILVSSWRNIPALRAWLSAHTTADSSCTQMNQLCCSKGHCAIRQTDFDRKMSEQIRGTGGAAFYPPLPLP